jgi:LysM repeat protein
MRRLQILIVLTLALAACDGQSGTVSPGAPVTTQTPTPQIGVTLVTRAPPTSVVVQTTPTPLPSATATPSPTPIIYVVSEGDTLLGIALANRTTVPEIEALNPGIVPELLQIGQSLALPPPATPIYGTEANTPLPLQISVRSVHAVRTPSGSLWILGEVENESNFPAAGVRLQIELRDGNGPALTVPAWMAGGVIAPLGRAPFAVLVTQAPPADVQPVVSVVAGETLAQQGTYYLQLEATAANVQLREGATEITGTIRNQGDATVALSTIIATFYDDSGQVSGYAQEDIPGPLAPGESALFVLDVAPPGGQPVDYALTVQGLTE